MAKEVSEREAQDKLERKEVAKRRVFWFLIIFSVVLVGYLAFQIVMLVLHK